MTPTLDVTPIGTGDDLGGAASTALLTPLSIPPRPPGRNPFRAEKKRHRSRPPKRCLSQEKKLNPHRMVSRPHRELSSRKKA